MAGSGFGCRLRVPKLEILEGGIGFEKVEETIDGQSLVDIFDRKSLQTGEVVRRPNRYSAQSDGA